MDSEKQAVYRIGLDVGSTTAKIVVLDKQGAMVYQSYRRHLSNVEEAVARFLDELQTIVSDGSFQLAVTGSVGLGLSERHQLPFVQEVVAAAEFTKQLHPDIRTIIDIGGEDAKIVYLQDGRVVDLRMNGNCAGGTGAFIDQMALCLGVEVGEMNGLALAADTVYPIASRCGVFSKTDIQNLIARNVSKQNIAASIFHAVAVQTASALSHGMEVKPKVLMCGGPLTFIPALRKAIAEYFQLDPDKDVLMEEHANVIPAWGTALSIDPSSDEGLFTTDSLRTRLATVVKKAENGAVVKNKTFVTLPPIFESEEDYLQWKLEKSKSYVKLRSLSDLPKGEKTYLGIDSGSTTTKIVLMGEQGDIYFTHYVHNGGNPIAAVGNGLELLDRQCRQEGIDLHITAACSTGYGEDLIKAAYSLDYGMIETMAHYMAARRICPEVSFILDIGGQDMKAIYVDNGVLTRMEINEACSSGCGSFIETFAQTLKLEIKEFVMKACESKRPSDLGTRCTVFMNSKVKQVLREGATVSDIAAGLAYSVVKNCLFKVLKLKNYDELGEHIVLQGGTMRNDSVVKAFENLTGRVVQCNNIPELMGAYGCALFARQKTDAQKTALPLQHYLSAAAFEQKTLGCHGCENQCRITRYTFNNGRHYFSGNKCERIYTNGSGDGHKGVNLSRRKYELLFDRARNTGVNSQGVTFGIPRALNMYEEFPFWHTFFTQCGFGVELSSDSTYARYEKGVHTVMSDNICFPAKLVHSHIYELDANEKVDRIFYPRVMFEEKEDQTATDSLNCPIVIGYPEVVHSSVKTVKPVDSPVISFADPQLLLQQLYTYLKPFHVDKAVIRRAHAAALEEMHRFGEEMRRINEETLARARAEKRLCMLLVGRPYHTDPLVQHKVSDMIASLGVDVLTEDVVRKLDMPGRESFALKQWTYVNRIQNAARWAAAQDHLVHMVQTTSFGCGPDAFFLDEVRAILALHGKALTLLKIDDINNVGSMKLRVRSLIDSLQFGVSEGREPVQKPFVKPARYEEGDNQRRTILAPFFTEYLSPLMKAAFAYAGYKLEQLPMGDAESNDLGLKYANNEVCYPATLIVGDFIKALQSGRYDLNRVALGITQLGKCRATNYPALIRRAVVDAGFSQVPVIGIGGTDNDDNPGFHLNYAKVAPIVLYTVFFGDWLSQFYHAVAVREKNKGEARRLRDNYLRIANVYTRRGNHRALLGLIKKAAADFNAVPVYEDRIYPKVGVTGEIYLKFNPYSHKYVPDWLMEHGVEVVPSAVHNFFLRYFVNYEFNRRQHVSKPKLPPAVVDALWYVMKRILHKFEEASSGFRYFQPEEDIRSMAEYAEEVLCLSAQFGEGWLLPGEVIAFMKQGCNNVVSMQPFGCIANHIVARGIEKKLKTAYPQLNMLSLDFDGGVSEANIANRLLLFISSMK